MITCRECGHEEIEGMIFCTMCGASLIELEGQQAVLEDAPEPEPPPLMGQTESSPEWEEIIIILPTSGRRLHFKPGREIYIGRSVDGTPNQPEVNLEIDGGNELGVSRSHAVIRPDEQGVGIVIVDLNSTNGTLLNQFKLPPELPYPIKNGDEIQFGNLLMHVFLKQSA
ncbi:MAG: FHA domain-containing protein [Chloroflexota bacterium]